MKKLAHFNESLVLYQVAAGDKWSLIAQMVDALAASAPVQAQRDCISRAMLLEAVTAREKERSTALGNGVAFPHARIPGLRRAVLCVALPREPVDFDAPYRKFASVAAMMLVPEDQPQIALQLMAQFARVFSDPVERAAFMRLDTVSGLYEYICRKVLANNTPVTARDIMRAPVAVVHPDTPLREVTRIMNDHMMDTIMVVEADGTLAGEITCDNLFKLGMPHFFTQLKSIAFISEFDPFEKYFAGESRALARDVMSHDFTPVTEDATLLEIVFELAVHQRPIVYVVRDGKCVGVIDRILVLDRVINV